MRKRTLDYDEPIYDVQAVRLSGSKQTRLSALVSFVGGARLWLHLLTLPVGGVRVSCVHLTITLLVHLVHATCILLRNLAAGRCVANGREVRTSTRGIVLPRWCLSGIVGLAVDGAATIGAALSLLLGLACIVFFLLACFPFLANLFELYDVSRYVSIDPR